MVVRQIEKWKSIRDPYLCPMEKLVERHAIYLSEMIRESESEKQILGSEEALKDEGSSTAEIHSLLLTIVSDFRTVRTYGISWTMLAVIVLPFH